jgi:hypothetical protein
LKNQPAVYIQGLKCESPISSPISVDLTELWAMATTAEEEELVREAWLLGVATAEDGDTG